VAEPSNVAAIRAYFEDFEKPVSLKELKDLSADDRQELGDLARKELAESE